jgi:ferredoxin-type protein NapG
VDSNSDKPVDRRRFFRVGLSELLKPLAKAAAPLERMMTQLGKLDQVTPQHRAEKPEVWLRPPGSLAEPAFRGTCQQTGACVNVCPAQAIRLEKGKAGGVPYIDADFAACVVCTGLKCMSVCPSGAIVPTSINDIDMGTAVWHQSSCLRSHGDDCTICVERCPLGSAAIEVKAGEIAVKPLGCIGCGVCQFECPTSPKSIVVIPIAAKAAGRSARG